SLVQALELAQPQGYRRVFLDEGRPAAALLRAALPGLARRSLAAFAGSLLRAFGPEPGHETDAPLGGREGYRARDTRHPPLLYALSPQELRVLRLLAAGLSNAAIASELVVSTNTVKTQLKSIYRKLDVANRDEAREAARERNLI